MNDKAFLLPIAVVSPMDIARLVRELHNLEEYFSQNAIRTGAAPEVPRYSRLLDAIIVVNKIDLVDESERSALLDRFASMQETAPVMHISFSVDPPGAYVQKIVAWLRENIHPLVLVRVGLQPSIGAGCIVRTTNKAFDFSLRKYFDTKHDFFVQKLHYVVAENSTGPDAMQPQAVQVVVAGEPAPVAQEAVEVPAPVATPEAVPTAEPVAVAEPPEIAATDPVVEAEAEQGETIPVTVENAS